MSSLSTKLVDLLRGKKDREAMGPMRYRQDGRGRMVPDDERAASASALSKALRPMVGHEKTETLRERQMRELGL